MFPPKKIVKQNSTVCLIFPPWNNTCTLFSSTFHFFPFWPFLQRPGRDCLSTSIKIKPKVSASDKLNWWIKPVEISQSAGFSPEQQKTVFFKTDSITSWKIVSVGKCVHTEIQISKYKSSLALFPSLSRSGFSYFFGKQDNTTTAKNDKFKVIPPGPPHICSGRDCDGDSPDRYFLVFSSGTLVEKLKLLLRQLLMKFH